MGPYVVRESVGAGGMGEVYRAYDPRLHRDVAIKVLPEEVAGDPTALARFEREARAVAALAHPNILVIHDVGAEGPLRFAVTELLDGATLSVHLGNGPVPWRRAVAIAAEVADGLAAAHARGIVHRDLKPSNLFVTTDGRVKILDFGVARVAAQTLPPGSAGDPTVPGTVLGSVGYMSPEQAAGGEVDPRSDVFSLGCVLYEMLSGRRAFAGRTPVDVLAAVVRDDPPPLAVDGLPPELPPLVERCLRKPVGERFASAADVALALRSLLTHSGGLAAPQGARESLAAGAAPPPPRWWRHLGSLLRRRRGRIRSLAVLPFANAGSDPGGEYLSDGISESVIRSLTAVGDLRVLAWSTVTRFRGPHVAPREAGETLGVEALLTGRVVDRGDLLVVSVELVDVASGDCLWAERYVRPPAQFFAVQEGIAQEIAGRLRVRLTGRARSELAKRPTADDEAYRLYLKGRYCWNRRSEAGLAKSREHFEQALALDPAYALAWAGLADSYSVLPFWGLMAPGDAFPKAKASALEALRRDPELAEGHASLAYVHFYYDWDWRGAQREFAAALSANPNYPTAHHWLGVCLGLVGEPAQALAALRRAQELDPLSLIINADLALASYWQGRHDEVVRQCEAVLELDPGFPPALLYLGLATEQLGRHEAAQAALERAVDLSAGGTAATAALAHARASAGDREEARRLLAELLARPGDRYLSPYLVAVVQAGLGEVEAAWQWLERALAERCEMLVWLPRDPRLAGLAGDPRFARLRRFGPSATQSPAPPQLADTTVEPRSGAD